MSPQPENKKKKPLQLQPVTHTLLHPVTGESTEITALTFQPMTFGLYNEVDVQQDDQNAVVEAFALMLTGISEAAFNQLSLPDFNSVTEIITRFVTQKSPEWLPGIQTSHDTIQLAMPVSGDDGRTISDIQLRVPSVRTLKIYKSLPNAAQQQKFITQECTGLSESETDRLFMPDWNQIQENIDHFLNRPAGFFQTGM